MYEACGEGFAEPTEYIRQMLPVTLGDDAVSEAWTYVYNWPVAACRGSPRDGFWNAGESESGGHFQSALEVANHWLNPPRACGGEGRPSEAEAGVGGRRARWKLRQPAPRQVEHCSGTIRATAHRKRGEGKARPSSRRIRLDHTSRSTYRHSAVIALPNTCWRGIRYFVGASNARRISDGLHETFRCQNWNRVHDRDSTRPPISGRRSSTPHSVNTRLGSRALPDSDSRALSARRRSADG